MMNYQKALYLSETALVMICIRVAWCIRVYNYMFTGLLALTL